MAKKRGGLAGIYDRNKGLVRTAAILGATALGGPAAGAAAGAAIRGLDREGQRGIGFDVGQGIRGGIEGYTVGKLGQSAAGALKSGGISGLRKVAMGQGTDNGKWGMWGQLGAAGINAIGSSISSSQNAALAKAELEEKRRQFDQEMALSRQKYNQSEAQYAQNDAWNNAKYQDERGIGAAKLQGQLNLSPLADKASYMLMQRLGVAPAAFQPRDYTKGTMPGAGAAAGGYSDVLAADQRALGSYTAGAGGWKTDALQAAYDRMRDPKTLPSLYQGADAITKRFLPYVG